MSPDDTAAEYDDAEGESPDRLGIYYVASDELTDPPETRTYQRKAVWTPEGWEAGSDGEIIEDAVRDRPHALTAEWLRERFSSRNYFVMPPEAVPGDVEDQDPLVTADDVGYVQELRPAARGSSTGDGGEDDPA